jgi:hypothetical protein
LLQRLAKAALVVYRRDESLELFDLCINSTSRLVVCTVEQQRTDARWGERPFSKTHKQHTQTLALIEQNFDSQVKSGAALVEKNEALSRLCCDIVAQTSPCRIDDIHVRRFIPFAMHIF